VDTQSEQGVQVSRISKGAQEQKRLKTEIFTKPMANYLTKFPFANTYKTVWQRNLISCPAADGSNFTRCMIEWLFTMQEAISKQSHNAVTCTNSVVS